jgi:hypothetical protein
VAATWTLEPPEIAGERNESPPEFDVVGPQVGNAST